MNVLKILKLNLRIIQVMNSCDRKQFISLLDDVIDIPGIFRKKYYIWNIIRPRDMYKMIAFWVIGRYEKYQNDMKDPIALARTLGLDFDGDVATPMQIAIVYLLPIEMMIKEILETTKSDNIKRTFIWNIMKACPILTVDTIRYASPEKIKNLLTGDKDLICDAFLTPIVDVIMEYRDHIKAYQAIMEDTSDV